MARPVLWFGAAVVTLAVTAAVPAAGDVPPQRKWLEVRSPHFRVMGDAAERDLRQVAERMEQLHALLTMLAPQAVDRAPDTTVIVFRDRRGYQPFQPLYDGKPQDVAGYFVGGAMNYITLLAVAERESQGVVYHEYVHLALDRAVGQVAPWIGEGLAEFYSTFEVTDGGKTAQLGGLRQQHLWRLQELLLPLATLVEVDHGSPYYNERDKSSVFYAESWALVHYLQLGGERKYSAKFAPFMTAIADGVPFATACTRVLGVTPEVLEQELRTYVHRPVLYRAAIQLPARIATLERLPSAVVPEPEVHATLGDLLTRLDGRAAAREHLEHALRLDGGQALALGSLALVEVEAQQRERTRELALRTPGQPTYLTEFYRAQALEQAAPDMTADAAAIEAALRQTVALNPTFAPGLAALARRLSASVAGRDEALQLIARAIPLAPMREEYVLLLARIHLLKGDTKTARARLGPLLARGHTPEIKDSARQLMGYAAKLETSAADDTPVPETPAAADEAPGRERPEPAMTPDLRAVAEGELRASGTMASIECGTDGVVITVATATGALRLRAAAFDQVQFISYRDELRGSVNCGPQPSIPVLVAYRPGAGADTVGVVVAVEYVPNGFRPPPEA